MQGDMGLLQCKKPCHNKNYENHNIIKEMLIAQGFSFDEYLNACSLSKEEAFSKYMLYGGMPRTEAAEGWMEALDISSLRDAMPAELSGGELRRMAIARTLTADPAVILADEPTGDLDNENTEIVLNALKQAAKAGKAVLVVSHEDDAEAFADRVLHMENGNLTES